MSRDFKVSDTFGKNLVFNEFSGKIFVDNIHSISFTNVRHGYVATHAINNHDKLTEELQAKTDFLSLKVSECDSLTERVKELEEDLQYWVGQYGCECGHPACRECQFTKESKQLLEKE